MAVMVRHSAALDAVEPEPRYGNVISPPPADMKLLGCDYAAPIGGPFVVFPGRAQLMARAAHATRVHYVFGLMAGISGRIDGKSDSGVCLDNLRRRQYALVLVSRRDELNTDGNALGDFDRNCKTWKSHQRHGDGRL